MAVDQAVSDGLKSVIVQLMQADCLRDLTLGAAPTLPSVTITGSPQTLTSFHQVWSGSKD